MHRLLSVLQVFVYGDCAINVNPDSQQLADIAVSSANTAKAFGIKPRVALLSYATGDSNSGDLITKVKEGCEKAQAMATEQTLDFPIEGPLQFDAAVDPEVAKVKVKTASEVAGRANVCVFPDLNTGTQPANNSRIARMGSWLENYHSCAVPLFIVNDPFRSLLCE